MAERKAFLLRIDPALWAELEAWAQSELRSVNGQVEYLLRQAVGRRKGGSAPANSALPPPPPPPDLPNSRE
jgi:hypothetical protein